TASQATLEGLLPVGTPLPQAVEGTQVLVDWAGVISIAETGNLGFEVEVLVRSMVSAPGEGFVRVEPSVVVVEVAIGPDGIPRVVRPPQVERHTTVSPFVMSLVAIPDSLKEEVEGIYGPVVGGEQLGDGRWRVVLMATDPDGVTRPRTVIVP